MSVLKIDEVDTNHEEESKLSLDQFDFDFTVDDETESTKELRLKKKRFELLYEGQTKAYLDFDYLIRRSSSYAVIENAESS